MFRGSLIPFYPGESEIKTLMNHVVGLDSMFRRMTENLNIPSFPPYNIEKVNDNEYRVSFALAGFGSSDIKVTTENGVLTIEGNKEEKDEETNYLYKGISSRKFKASIPLAETIKVGSAEFENGLLKVSLDRVIPEEMQPKQIEIKVKN